MKSQAKVLFILKHRESSSGPIEGSYENGTEFSSGLWNSARFVFQMLQGEGIHTKIVQVIDNNCIDREVHIYRPTHVVIEALWVVPEKFGILQALHPDVKWIIRGHSELPFLAGEGIAIDWLCRYVQYKNVYLAFNSKRATHDIRNLIAEVRPEWSASELAERVLYLPNYYPHHERFRPDRQDNGYLDVACFGAIRPLKNQLIQAMAAIEYAKIVGKLLRFHINGTRPEQGGNENLKNLRALFRHTRHILVEHPWMDHTQFRQLLTTMDIGLQVSFTETFNIVSADMVCAGLPIVVSNEVTWVNQWCKADPNSREDITDKMIKVMDWRLRAALKILNMRNLKSTCNMARVKWLHWLT